MGIKRSRILLLLLLLARLPDLSWAQEVRVLKYRDDSSYQKSSDGESYSKSLDPARVLASMTLCFRIRLLHVDGRTSFINLSSERDGSRFVIRPEIWLDRVRIVLGNNFWIMMPLQDHLSVHKWHHLCFTYDHEAHEATSYVDGRAKLTVEVNVDEDLRADLLWLGRGPDALRLNFVGELTQVNIWSRVLSPEEMQGLAACEGDPQGDFLSWEVDLRPENVTQYAKPLFELCQNERTHLYFWFPLVTLPVGRYLCESLGTRLPKPTTLEEVRAIKAEAAIRWPDVSDRPRDFWTSINDRREEGVWTSTDDPLTPLSLPWSKGEPNGHHYENCVYIGREDLYDVDCGEPEVYAACKFSERHTYTLKGCEAEKETVTFLANQDGVGELVFDGIGKSQILKRNGSWEWIDATTDSVFARLEGDSVPHYPMGRRWWNLSEGVCPEDPARRRLLLLTSCPEGHFSCDDATCIRLSDRCDRKYECRDSSDELDCQLIVFPGDYNRDIYPKARSISKDSVPITLDFDIETVVVDTEKMMMTLSFVLSMEWSDERLQYQNLKVNESGNEITPSTLHELWTPLVRFMNADGNYHTQVDLFTTAHVKRLCQPVTMNKSAPAEVEVYDGQCNPITIQRRYNLKFVCSFNLLLYPFDSQSCFAHLRILSATKDYLRFHPNHSTARYTGNPRLNEYEVGRLTLRHDYSNTYSESFVKVPLSRLCGYAILNIYLPSQLLLIISYITLFFSEEVFEVRMMASLTNLLVMATLFTQTSASLPKTSYFKMVDVWLLMCIGIIFLVVIVHALIDYNLRLQTGATQVLSVRPVGHKTLSAPKTARKMRVEKMVVASRICIPLIFFAFIVVYILYIKFN